MNEKLLFWMRSQGVPEAFIAHLEKTGEIDGKLWPIKYPVNKRS